MKLSKALQGFSIDRRAQGYSPATIKVYESCLNHFRNFLGEVEIENITKLNLLEFFYYLRTEYKPRRFSGSLEPLSPASLDNFWISLRSLYKWCHLELEIENISLELPRPKFEPPEIAPLSRKEILEILQAATLAKETDAGTKSGKRAKLTNADRDRAIILLLLDTGIRLGELCRLKIEDIDIDTSMITVRPFQSSRKSRPRQIPLGTVARKAVWKYLASQDDLRSDDLLFGMTNGGVQSMFYRIKKRTGNDKIHAVLFGTFHN